MNEPFLETDEILLPENFPVFHTPLTKARFVHKAWDLSQKALAARGANLDEEMKPLQAIRSEWRHRHDDVEAGRRPRAELFTVEPEFDRRMLAKFDALLAALGPAVIDQRCFIGWFAYRAMWRVFAGMVRDPEVDDTFTTEEDIQIRRAALDGLKEAMQLAVHRLHEKGLDPETVFAGMEKKFANYEASARKVDRVENELLQAKASLADTKTDLYLKLCDSIHSGKQNDPLNPVLDQMREVRDALQLEIPRELWRLDE
ncbi:MAG TPA: hypothetical protein VI454_04390 [Verrucomicrobiae bacterium]|jgi:hypothetical protein